MRITIIGSTGYVGGALVHTLAHSFPEIKLVLLGTNRTKLVTLSKLPNVEEIISYRHGDSLEGAFEGSDACIDLSYQTSGVPSKQVHDSVVHAQNLVRSCKRQGVKRLCIVGSVAVYGTKIIRHPWPEAPLPDKLPFPDTVYARVKAVVEKVAFDEAKREGIPLALVRSGHIVGAGSRTVTNLCSALLSGEPVLLDGLSGPSNGTTLIGLNRTLIQMALTGWGKELIVGNHVDLSLISYETLVRAIADMMGVEARSVPIPTANKGKWRDVAINWVYKHRDRVLVLQSYLRATEKYMMSQAEKVKSERTVSGSTMQQSLLNLANSLVSLYRSGRVPHARLTAFGSSIPATEVRQKLADIKSWIQDAGYFPDTVTVTG